MGTQESGVAKAGAGKGPLDGLAQRLGALEESLTVVAGELGVSAVPKFKRLDPDSVYNEAIRRAHEAVEPLRLALRKVEARLEEMALGHAQLRRDAGNAAKAESLVAIQQQVMALAARLDATVMPIDQNETKLAALDETVGRLSMRLETIWEHVDARTRAEQQKTSDISTLAQRLGALEQRLERLASAVIAHSQPASAAQNAGIDERLALFQRQIVAELERRLAASASLAPAPQPDRTQIAAEVARQIQAFAKDSAAPMDGVPLLAEQREGVNPLVISAAERAIVRLTHRLEKLEEWRRRNSAERDRKSGGLMGRLFES
jgi:hypothetical protein